MSNICEQLHHRVRGLPRYRAGFDPDDIPANGIYFLFEKGEEAHGGERIVRIGTHTGQGNLPKRIVEHLYTQNKDRSIFRKHVGRCLLRRDNDPFAKFWELDLTKKADKERYAAQIDEALKAKTEDDVTRYMTEAFSFSVVRFDKKEDRLRLEEKFISTLCQCGDCSSSPGWLGRFHPNPSLAASGLWNIQGQKGESLSAAEMGDLDQAL